MFKTGTIKPALKPVEAAEQMLEQNQGVPQTPEIKKLAANTGMDIADQKQLEAAKISQLKGIQTVSLLNSTTESTNYKYGSPEFEKVMDYYYHKGASTEFDPTIRSKNIPHIDPEDHMRWIQEHHKGMFGSPQDVEAAARNKAVALAKKKWDERIAKEKAEILRKAREDCLKHNGMHLKYPDDIEDEEDELKIILASCELLKKRKEMVNKMHLDELAKNTDGMADACGFGNYDATGALNDWVNSAMGMTMFDRVVGGEDPFGTKFMKCLKGILNVGTTLAKMGMGAIGFATQGNAGMIDAAMEFSGASNIIKPVKSLKQTASNLDPTSKTSLQDMGAAMARVQDAPYKMMHAESHGLNNSPLDGKFIDDTIKSKSKPLFENAPGMTPNDYDMIGAVNRAVA